MVNASIISCMIKYHSNNDHKSYYNIDVYMWKRRPIAIHNKYASRSELGENTMDEVI